MESQVIITIGERIRGMCASTGMSVSNLYFQDEM